MSVLVGKSAPDFAEKAVIKEQIKENFSLSQFKGKKYVVLFFYPLDFTFVCPTEMHAFQEKKAEFEARDCQVIACSTDSWFSHTAWLQTPKTEGGIEGVEYPIISDFNKTIAESYDVLLDGGMALRGLFLIDKEGIVKHQTVNDLGLGRNVNEVLRLVDALQYTEKHGEVCPANWNKGDEGMTTDSEGLKKYFK